LKQIADQHFAPQGDRDSSPIEYRASEATMSEFAARSPVSEELASFIREGIQAFCEFFKTSQFDKMAQFYSPDTTLMLPHRPAIRGTNSLPAVFSKLKETGLRDWRIEPNRIGLATPLWSMTHTAF